MDSPIRDDLIRCESGLKTEIIEKNIRKHFEHKCVCLYFKREKNNGK